MGLSSTVNARRGLHRRTPHDLGFPFDSSVLRACRPICDGHGNLCAFVAFRKALPPTDVYQSLVIRPIEALDIPEERLRRRLLLHIGPGFDLLCPCGEEQLHFSKPRLRSTRRLIRPHENPPHREIPIPAAGSNAYWLDGTRPYSHVVSPNSTFCTFGFFSF